MKRSLFIFALASASSSLAAVGDVVSGVNTKYVVDGVLVDSFGAGRGQYSSVDQINSTRFYDSNKGGPWTKPYYDGTEGDSLMCWSHAASNAIQYWQDVYGVFYTDKGNMAATGSTVARDLYNGYYSTTLVTDYDTVIGNQYAKVEVNNAKELNVARSFYSNWENAAGLFSEAVDWYFRWDSTTSSEPGGYYSDYFGNYNSGTPAYVLTSISSDMGALRDAISTGLGLEMQGDGNFKSVNDGMIASISIHYDVWSDTYQEMVTYGHVMNCAGFTTDSNGNLVSILLANGDDGVARLQEVYVKLDGDKIKLYQDKSHTSLWQSGTEWYVTSVSYINTPEVLQNMLSEYRDTNEAAVWSGTSSEWSTQVDVVDSEIADASTGWDVLVNGDNIDAKHHDYYHGYALEGRNVLFGDHAAEGNRTVTINGMVSAGHIEVAAAGYQFKKGTDGAIDDGADMTVRSGASLDSEVALKLGDLELEQGALLSSSETIIVTGAFLTSLQESASFSLRNAVTPSASVAADLDLRMATSITLNTAVDMNGHDLFLSADTPITISLSEVDGSILLFENIGTLSVEGITEVITEGMDLTQYFSITSTDGADLSGYSLLYANNALSMSIVPEPTTATLSLLALAALAARRRRK